MSTYTLKLEESASTLEIFPGTSTVESRYLELGYLETLAISNTL